VTLPPGIDERLGLIAELAEGSESGSVHLCLNGEWISTIALSTERQTHGIGLPGSLIEADSELELVSAPSDTGQDPPAFRLESLWFTPIETRPPAPPARRRRGPCEAPVVLRGSW
jgi:hypothetical protein